MDWIGRARFASARLRVTAADTLLLEDGVLAPHQSVRLRLLGRGGAPAFLEGRWLRTTGEGPPVKHDEVDVR